MLDANSGVDPKTRSLARTFTHGLAPAGQLRPQPEGFSDRGSGQTAHGRRWDAEPCTLSVCHQVNFGHGTEGDPFAAKPLVKAFDESMSHPELVGVALGSQDRSEGDAGLFE